MSELRGQDVTVRRLRSSCCGMEEGEVYRAKMDGSYFQCQLPDGTWTSAHFSGQDGSPIQYFEVVDGL